MKKKNVKYICNNCYTRVFIRPRTVTKLRTLRQLRHRSVAKGLLLLCKPCKVNCLVSSTFIPIAIIKFVESFYKLQVKIILKTTSEYAPLF